LAEEKVLYTYVEKVLLYSLLLEHKILEYGSYFDLSIYINALRGSMVRPLIWAIDLPNVDTPKKKQTSNILTVMVYALLLIVALMYPFPKSEESKNGDRDQ